MSEPKSVVYCMDCLEAMRKMPDKCFDLAVVDPPYGDINSSGSNNDNTSKRVNHAVGGRFEKYNREADTNGTDGNWINWDVTPPDEYFDELFRVSENQIIWGGNYFQLPPNRCFLIWHKPSIPEEFSMAMAEYAWTSFDSNSKLFSYVPQGQTGRFHPTQKPIELYAWIFSRYANKGDKILDTHLGSGSSRIAAWNAGLDFVGFEIDPDYFEKQEQRFRDHSAQINLFHAIDEP